jgi:hypothetical protein
MRFISAAGATRTVGLARSAAESSFDLGPLVGATSDHTAPSTGASSIECPNAVGQPVAVPVTSASSTPAEALRAFLESGAAARLDVPTPPRPFHEYRVAGDGSTRFEHYTNFDEHVAISVVASGSGWAVVGWLRQRC